MSFSLHSLAIILMAVLAYRRVGVAGSHDNAAIDYMQHCKPTDTCKYKNTGCINGICQCKAGYVLATYNGQILCLEIVPIHNIATVEDHPWVIKNETCLDSPDADRTCRSSCYTGFLVDILRIMDKEFKNLDNCTITEVDSFGTLDSSSDPPAWKSGLMSIVANNQTDVAMAAFNASKIDVEVRKVMRYSTPFVSNPYKRAQFALGFPLSSKAGSQIQAIIHNLKKKRCLEYFLIKWFINGTSLWSMEKQKTPYTPTQVCQTM
ncbi:uncharacterized protein LOC110861130 [Folsomia candida]|uniref:uncharacterized protein LOC110861130 n=1 Tax=Folsomia candida TaxID=158441 RepID=UPI000B8F0FD3|nr:uncharacterized protein LOC110861130 [Folsomia candida]